MPREINNRKYSLTIPLNDPRNAQAMWFLADLLQFSGDDLDSLDLDSPGPQMSYILGAMEMNLAHTPGMVASLIEEDRQSWETILSLLGRMQEAIKGGLAIPEKEAEMWRAGSYLINASKNDDSEG